MTWTLPATARRMLTVLLALLIATEAVTGILLSLWYAPSRQPVQLANGTPATIIVGERTETRGVFTDTVGVSGRASLVPARAGEPIPSVANASVQTQIMSAPGGAVLRSIHHHTAPVLVIVAVLLLVLVVAPRLGATSAFATVAMATAISVLAFLLVWSGRLLPDDVYAEISRRIVAHELRHAPFGSFLTVLFGIEPDAPLLNRTFAVHLFMGIGLAILGWLAVRRVGTLVPRQWVGIGTVALAIIVVAAISPLPASTMRDAVRGLAGTAHANVWWILAPFEALVDWLGGELMGYTVLGLVGLILWRGSRGGSQRG